MCYFTDPARFSFILGKQLCFREENEKSNIICSVNDRVKFIRQCRNTVRPLQVPEKGKLTFEVFFTSCFEVLAAFRCNFNFDD